MKRALLILLLFVAVVQGRDVQIMLPAPASIQWVSMGGGAYWGSITGVNLNAYTLGVYSYTNVFTNAGTYLVKAKVTTETETVTGSVSLVVNASRKPCVKATQGPNDPMEPATTSYYTITRSLCSDYYPLTVYYSMSLAASNGVDYTWLPGSVVIPSGSMTADIVVHPINDALAEGEEQLKLTLTPDATYSNAGSVQTFTMYDDDKPTVTLTVTDATATEAGPTTGAYLFTEKPVITNDLIVTVLIAGTASNGVDYVTIPTNHTILANVGTLSLLVTPIDDASVETNETVILNMVTKSPYDSLTTKRTVTITSNE